MGSGNTKHQHEDDSDGDSLGSAASADSVQSKAGIDTRDGTGIDTETQAKSENILPTLKLDLATVRKGNSSKSFEAGNGEKGSISEDQGLEQNGKKNTNTMDIVGHVVDDARQIEISSRNNVGPAESEDDEKIALQTGMSALKETQDGISGTGNPETAFDEVEDPLRHKDDVQNKEQSSSRNLASSPEKGLGQASSIDLKEYKGVDEALVSPSNALANAFDKAKVPTSIVEQLQKKNRRKQLEAVRLIKSWTILAVADLINKHSEGIQMEVPDPSEISEIHDDRVMRVLAEAAPEGIMMSERSNGVIQGGKNAVVVAKLKSSYRSLTDGISAMANKSVRAYNNLRYSSSVANSRAGSRPGTVNATSGKALNETFSKILGRKNKALSIFDRIKKAKGPAARKTVNLSLATNEDKVPDSTSSTTEIKQTLPDASELQGSIDVNETDVASHISADDESSKDQAFDGVFEEIEESSMLGAMPITVNRAMFGVNRGKFIAVHFSKSAKLSSSVKMEFRTRLVKAGVEGNVHMLLPDHRDNSPMTHVWGNAQSGNGGLEIRLHPQIRTLVVHKQLPVGAVILPYFSRGGDPTSLAGSKISLSQNQLISVLDRTMSDADMSVKLGIHPNILHLVGVHKHAQVQSILDMEEVSDREEALLKFKDGIFKRRDSADSRKSGRSAGGESYEAVPGKSQEWLNGCECVWEYIDGISLHEAIHSKILYKERIGQLASRGLHDASVSIESGWVLGNSSFGGQPLQESSSSKRSRRKSSILNDDPNASEGEDSDGTGMGMQQARAKVLSKNAGQEGVYVSALARLLDISIQLAWAFEHVRKAGRSVWGLGSEDIWVRQSGSGIVQFSADGNVKSKSVLHRGSDPEDTVYVAAALARSRAECHARRKLAARKWEKLVNSSRSFFINQDAFDAVDFVSAIRTPTPAFWSPEQINFFSDSRAFRQPVTRAASRAPSRPISSHSSVGKVTGTLGKGDSMAGISRPSTKGEGGARTNHMFQTNAAAVLMDARRGINSRPDTSFGNSTNQSTNNIWNKAIRAAGAIAEQPTAIPEVPQIESQNASTVQLLPPKTPPLNLGALGNSTEKLLQQAAATLELGNDRGMGMEDDTDDDFDDGAVLTGRKVDDDIISRDGLQEEEEWFRDSFTDRDGSSHITGSLSGAQTPNSLNQFDSFSQGSSEPMGVHGMYSEQEEWLDEPDGCSDVFTWALIVIELFSGHRVWGTAENAKHALRDYRRWWNGQQKMMEQMSRFKAREHRMNMPPEMPAQLQELLDRCLSPSRLERFTDLNAVIQSARLLYFEIEGLPHNRPSPFEHKFLEQSSLCTQGLSRLQEQRYGEAFQLWQISFQSAKSIHPSTFHNAGNFLTQNGRISDIEFVEAVEHVFDSAEDCSKPDLIYLLARIHMSRGDAEMAIACIHKLMPFSQGNARFGQLVYDLMATPIYGESVSTTFPCEVLSCFVCQPIVTHSSWNGMASTASSYDSYLESSRLDESFSSEPLALAVTRDKNVRIIRLKDGSELGILPAAKLHSAKINAVVADAKRTMAVTIGDDRKIIKWTFPQPHTAFNMDVAEIENFNSHDLLSGELKQDQLSLPTSGSMPLTKWKADCVQVIEDHPCEVRIIKISPCGSLMVTGGLKASISVYLDSSGPQKQGASGKSGFQRLLRENLPDFPNDIAIDFRDYHQPNGISNSLDADFNRFSSSDGKLLEKISAGFLQDDREPGSSRGQSIPTRSIDKIHAAVSPEGAKIWVFCRSGHVVRLHSHSRLPKAAVPIARKPLTCGSIGTARTPSKWMSAHAMQLANLEESGTQNTTRGMCIEESDFEQITIVIAGTYDGTLIGITDELTNAYGPNSDVLASLSEEASSDSSNPPEENLNGRETTNAQQSKTQKVPVIKRRSLILTRLFEIKNAHKRQITGVQMMPCGRMAVSGSMDSTIKLWDVFKGACIRTFDDFKSSINAIDVVDQPIHHFEKAAASPDEDTYLFAAASADKSLRTLKVGGVSGVNAVCPYSMPSTSDAVKDLSQDKRRGMNYIALADECAVKGDFKSMIRACVAARNYLGDNPDVTHRFSCMSSMSILTKPRKCLLSGQRVFPAHDFKGKQVALSSDESFYVTAGAGPEVKMWNCRTSRLLQTLKHKHDSGVNTMILSPDSHFVLTGGHRSWHMTDIRDGEQVDSFDGHHFDLTSLAMSVTGHLVVSGSFDGDVKVVDIGSAGNLTVRVFKGHTDAVQAVAISKRCDTIISASNDCTIRLWRVQDKSVSKLIQCKVPVTAMDVSKDVKRILGNQFADLVLWSGKTGKVLRSISGHKDAITCVKLGKSESGRLAFSCSLDRTLKIWALKAGTCILSMEADRPLVSFDCGKSMQWMVTIDDEATVRVWQVDWEVRLDGIDSGEIQSEFSSEQARLRKLRGKFKN